MKECLNNLLKDCIDNSNDSSIGRKTTVNYTKKENIDSSFLNGTILSSTSTKDCINKLLNPQLNNIDVFVKEQIIDKVAKLYINPNSSKYFNLEGEEKTIYRRCMESDIINVFNVNITLSKLECLNTNTWLNDEVINSFQSILMNDLGMNENYIVLNTFFADKVMESESKKPSPSYRDKSMKRWIQSHYKKKLSLSCETNEVDLSLYFNTLEIIAFTRNIDQVII